MGKLKGETARVGKINAAKAVSTIRTVLSDNGFNYMEWNTKQPSGKKGCKIKVKSSNKAAKKKPVESESSSTDDSSGVISPTPPVESKTLIKSSPIQLEMNAKNDSGDSINEVPETQMEGKGSRSAGESSEDEKSDNQNRSRPFLKEQVDMSTPERKKARTKRRKGKKTKVVKKDAECQVSDSLQETTRYPLHEDIENLVRESAMDRETAERLRILVHVHYDPKRPKSEFPTTKSPSFAEQAAKGVGKPAPPKQQKARPKGQKSNVNAGKIIVYDDSKEFKIKRFYCE